jgi:c-di-GMP-binding flagellar brake protein YcgR
MEGATMSDTQSGTEQAGRERRRYPRYDVTVRMSLAVEDESLGESIGIGEPSDISIGGLRVRHLPSHEGVRPGDRLGLLLIAEEEALSLHGEVVHHGTEDSFGVEFRDLSATDEEGVHHLVQRLNH